MEINSPPYPRNSCIPTELYYALRKLHEWVEDHQAWANMQAVELNAPETPFVPRLPALPPEALGKERYMSQGTPDMFIVWQAVRAIREKYDDIVRNYESEEDWESKAAIYYRITSVRSAALLVSLAFLDGEKREAKSVEIVKKGKKKLLKSIRKQLEDIPELKRIFEETSNDQDTLDDDDFNRLFHGEDDDDE